MLESKDNMMKLLSARDGFSLIEVVIAMILLTVGLMTLLSVTLGGLVQRDATREFDVARNAAFTQLEAIRVQDFVDIHNDYHNTYFNVEGLIAPTGWPQPGYISINNSVADLYDVTVTVRWQIKGNTNAAVYNEYITRSMITRRSKY
jgi:prepilin-type N-terminal cleavage/methylation domain-containing protein